MKFTELPSCSSHNASLHSLTTDLHSYDFYPQTLSFYLDSTWNSNPLTDKPDNLLSVGARLDLSMALNTEIPSSPCFPPLVPRVSGLLVVSRCRAQLSGPLSFHSAVSLGRPPISMLSITDKAEPRHVTFHCPLSSRPKSLPPSSPILVSALSAQPPNLKTSRILNLSLFYPRNQMTATSYQHH